MAEPALYARMELRIREFEKQLQKATRSTDQGMSSMEKRTKRAAASIEKDMTSSMTKVGGLMKNFGAGLLGGIAAGGVIGIVGQVQQVANGIATIGDEARRAGLSARAFQEFRFVAEQNRIGVDALVDGFKELNLRADEFIVTGGGSAAEAFQRLGYGATDLQEKLKDPSELILEIIGRLGQMDKASQIRVSDELFGGTAGERFVELLDQGEQGIRDTIDRAHELGLVIDDQLIAKAADLDQRFNQVANTVGTALKSAIVSAADSLAEFIDGFRAFENQRSASLSNRSTEIDRERLDLENRILETRNRPGMRDAAKNRAVGSFQIELDALNKESAEINRILGERSNVQAMQRAAATTWTPPASPPGGFGSTASKSGSGGGVRSSRDASASSAEREAEAVRDLISALDEELRLVGATDLQRDISNALRHAGASATEQQKAQIVSLVTAIAAEEEAVRNATDAMEEMRDLGRDVLGGFINDLRDGKSATEALGNALEKVADKLLNSGLDALFSGLGGGKSTGGGYLGATINFNLRKNS